MKEIETAVLLKLGLLEAVLKVFFDNYCNFHKEF